MAQVSFPGVYIVEAPSGVQTITGVATSIAAFIGTAAQGPMFTPTTVLSFTDYTRTFSSDTSTGEMTDQVQQFFQNGGQQAVVTRVANGATESSLVLKNKAGTTNVLTLTAQGAGLSGSQIRAAVDYDTGSPERTFNLTLFRETLDASGNPTVSATEVYSNVSVNPTDPRFVQTVVNNASALVVASTPSPSPSPTKGGYSFGAMLGLGLDVNTAKANFATALYAILTPPPATTFQTGSFQINVGGKAQTINFLPTSGTETADELATDLTTEINAQLGLATGTVVASIVTSGPTSGQALAGLQITAPVGQDVLISPAATSDIAVALGLGVAQGGIEVGAFAASDLRPLPTGFVSVIESNLATSTSPDALLAFALNVAADFTSLTLTQSSASFAFTGTVPFTTKNQSGGTQTTIAQGNNEGPIPSNTTVTIGSLLNVRDNMTALADAVGGFESTWQVELQGYRLAFIPVFGASTAGAGATIAATQNTWTDLSTTIFGSQAVSQNAALALAGGSDGAPPQLADYKTAFAAIDANVDLFNIMVLPRTAGANSSDRKNLGVWQAASTFCLQKRAFLLVDANATSIQGTSGAPNILAENAQLRVGMVKDHAALYWPHLVIPDGNGFTKIIDPSGSIAGIMARIDGTRGVWKAPAGLEADVRAITGVDVLMSDAQNGLINPQAINAIRSFPNGIVSWGARTMDGFDNSGDTDFKYVPVRRFELFLEESLVRGLKFAVFEPNAEPLWGQIRLAASAFLNTLFRAGAFAGTTPQTSYFVKVDSETTTQNDINLGTVNVLVGFAPLKPAEFIVITIQQLAGQIQV
jgi:phage tail sheath protein FI